MNETINSQKWIEIGRIVAPQGLKGELRVKTYSDFPERFENPGIRWLQRDPHQTPEAVELVSGYLVPGKNLYIVKLANVSDRTGAEQLRGCSLLVKQEDLPELDVDEYHVSKLIDVAVYDQLTGAKIGLVSAVLFAGNDLLEVTLDSESKEEPGKKSKVLIPFVKEIVPLVDLTAKRIEIVPPDGLLDLNV